MILLEQKRKQGTLDTIHFVGIGGIGMSGIAEIMINLGFKVQGSDLSSNNNTKRLQAMGIKVFEGQSAQNIHCVSYVVISTAIKADNPEVLESKRQNIPVIKRAEMLAELMRLKCSVAISGSHGKTTTTSLVACLFEAAGKAPTVINGGIINNRSTNAYIGHSDYLIAEADESDATFIKIPSTIGVITNIDPEHMDFYKNFDNLLDAFRSFINNLPFYGFGVLCSDHPVVRDIANEIVDRKIVTYGIDSDDAHIRAHNISSDIDASTFDVHINLPGLPGQTVISGVRIPTPGRHNVLNSLAAIAIGVELDFGIKVIKEGFQNFAGVKRRFTKVGEYNGAEIIDDYAHHPVEIEATVATAQTIAKKRGSEVIGIFQPHRYTRLADLFEDFAKCFAKCHRVYILDVFAAGEEPIKGFDSKTLSGAVEGSASHISKDQLPAIIMENAKPGNVILMMGAGSISIWANSMQLEIEALEKRAS